ncbi:hypothetical protein V7F95_08195 [Cutibacterium avidum]|uniref:hypothetical protein n=1 Tax=Cutibacterium avidum TaxID=33010 RepID=UPI002FF1D444
MMTNKGSMPIEDGSVAITGDQAEACSQLLRDHGATDLIDMLIDPRQIAPDVPDDPLDRPRRHSHIVTAFSRARKAA